MSPEEFAKRIGKRESEIAKFVRHDGPRLVGIKAVSFYKRNYRLGGYVDGGFHRWPITQRQLSGKPGAANSYGPLLSKRNRMFSSIGYRTGDGCAIVSSPVSYAKYHNDGTPRIPQRQFIYKSPEVSKLVRGVLKEGVRQILKQILKQ